MLKLAVVGGIILLGGSETARTLLRQAPLDHSGKSISPYVAQPEAFSKQLLQDTYFGPVLTPSVVNVVSTERLDEAALQGRATLMQWRLRVGFGTVTHEVDLVALMPNSVPEAPVIISQNFCPNSNVIPLAGVRSPDTTGFDCDGTGIASTIMTSLFGRYIVTPPLEDIMDRGYGYAALYPSQYIPDGASAGTQTLDRLFDGDPNRPGALSVWASLFPVAAQIIEAQYGPRPVIAFGHSRFGKTALIAGAWFDEIDAVIAHQSGTLGASAMDDAHGEPLASMVASYPHWPGPGAFAYADVPQALPVRPADLLALSGDKAILLGNARRDVWSDPWGAFVEARRGWPDAFRSVDPSDFRPTDRKAYWLRPGTHGVVEEDWLAFLDFLDAQRLGTSDEWRPREDLNPQPAD